MGLPLKGLRVVDLTKDFAGPFCTMMLADLGAEVIKVEKPGSGDETRAWGPPFIKGLSYYFLSLNRGKKSVALDLRAPESQKIVRQLAADSDILVESFRPGSLAKYNLDYSSLRRVNRALIYCSISGFGLTGPYRDRPGYDIVAFAMSGIMSATGEEGRPPIRVSVPVADIAAGHYAATAILASLAGRLVKGAGDHIDISLLDSIVSWLTYNATYYFATGKQQRRMGSAHPSIVPYQAFRCKDKDLIVAVGNDAQWNSFCKATRLERLREDRRFKTNPLRVRHRKILTQTLSKVFQREKAEHWYELLTKNGVPSAPVYGIRDVVNDPQIQHRRLVVKSRHIPLVGSPFKFLSGAAPRPSESPRLGGNTEEVLKLLGYSRSTIEKLATRGIIEKA